jgi:hypothetical protein
VISSDPIDHGIYIIIGLDLDERAAIFLDSWESMEILYEMFACLHHPVSSLHFPEEIAVLSHRREYLIECWLIVAREETPRIAERCSPNHKSIEILESSWMYHLRYPILIAHHITVTDNGDTYMLLELIDPSEISPTSECLFVGTTMD